MVEVSSLWNRPKLPTLWYVVGTFAPEAVHSSSHGIAFASTPHSTDG